MIKKIILLSVLWFPSFLLAQYYGERSTEQSFENSELYFNSHYLNTFGLSNFKKVAAGLIRDPFLNLYINPSNIPDLGENDIYLYLDFRGDRTKAPILTNYVIPLYYSRDVYYSPYIDPWWISLARSEPEPIFSVGILTNPLKEITQNFFIGGTYQLIHKEEKFYSVPYWIYTPRWLYDPFGIKVAEDRGNMPIIDRYSGKDEMINEGHLFSFFTGYKVMENLSVGVSLNGVIHSRDGGYLNSYKDEYGDIKDSESSSYQSYSRSQKYDHLDLSAGVTYEPTTNFSFGAKAGILKGKVDQDYSSQSSYLYRNNTPEVSKDWYYSLSNSSTIQTWHHDGSSKYIGINFIQKLKNGKEFSGYYRYTYGKEDFTNSSTIFDTSYYSSRWVYNYDSSWYKYRGSSLTSDVRHGSGLRERFTHEAMLNFKWELSSSSTLILGLYYNNFRINTFSTEPVLALRISDYVGTSSNPTNNYSYYHKLFEDKTLEWKYKSRSWSLQIPILLHFKFNKNWGIMLGLNRVLNGYEISDQTTAYFAKRLRVDNGTTKEEKNFGERYTQPTKKMTDDFTDIITSFDVSVSDEFKIRLLLDPEFENIFRIAQWWLSFEAKL